MTPHEKAAAIVQRMATKQLVEAMEITTGHTPEEAEVRHWIMDELERRNPAAFEAWIDAEPYVHSPRTFFL